MLTAIITTIATPVATALRGIHFLLSQFLAPSSGPAWALSIVLLTVCVRLVLFPLFVKQIKSQRRMQELAPKIKELQARHKGDRETLNTELMKLYKDNNANPISGCLPLLLQLPVFFALFSVIREFKPGAHAKYGLSAHDLAEGGRAKVFGAPISAGFRSGHDLLAKLQGDATTVRIVAVAMILLMGATTFWTQRQMMARAGASADPQQQQIQKFMLYVLPIGLAISGVSFPIGVLLYWLTTNVWSMGQQHYVIKRMPPVTPGGGGSSGRGGGPAGDRKGPGGGGGPGKPGKAKKAEPGADGTDGTEGPVATAASGVLVAADSSVEAVAGSAAGSGVAASTARQQQSKRTAGSRKNKKRRR